MKNISVSIKFQLSQPQRILLFIFLLCLLFVFNDGTTQPIKQQGKTKNRNSIPQVTKNTCSFLLNGILNGRYKKPGYREYFVSNQLELPEFKPGTLPPHPRLITAAQLRRARSNVIIRPYRDWYLLTRHRADNSCYAPNQIVAQLAEQAKACAFLYKLEDNPIYRQKAFHLLAQLPKPPEILNIQGGEYNCGWGDYLQSAEAVPALCVAYDLLEDEMPLDLKVDVERKLLGVVQQLVDGFTLTPRNNHVTVMAIAVTTAALSIDEPQRFLYYSQGELFQIGMQHLSLSLGLIAPDGGYAEGPYYAHYISNYLAPFSVYLSNVFNIHLFQHPYLQRMMNWIIDNDKGRGQYTQFDDSFSIRFFVFPLLIFNSSAAAYWDEYFRADSPFTKFYCNMIEALAVYRPHPDTVFGSPFFPGRFYMNMGQAIFKDRQPQPHFFAGFIFEQEKRFADMHEHIDPLSFEISAYGENFIIDGGYGSGTNDKERIYFLSPQANSTILIDGFGTDPNPLNGDELQGHLDFAFSTTNFAAAGLSHRIGDVLLTRQIFYPANNYLLVLDRMEDDSKHCYTVQLKYHGEFSDAGAGWLQFRKNQAQLDVFLFAENIPDWKFEESRGLATMGERVYEHNVLGIQSPITPYAELISLWVASETNLPVRVNLLPLVNGTGEWYQINNLQTNTTEDIVRNNADTVATNYWQSDAKLTWVKYRSQQDLCSVLLVDGSYFQLGDLQIHSSEIVTIYLERKGISWGGFIQFDSRPGEVILSLQGIDALPARLNNQLLNSSKKKQQLILHLPKSGFLTLGINEVFFNKPHKYNPETNDVLRWLLQKPKCRFQNEYWTQYEKNVVENQITQKMIWGLEKAAKYWGDSITGDSLIFQNSTNVLLGLMRYTYHSTIKNGEFQLPHRYGWDTKLKGSQWQIREEGNWRNDGLEVRDLWIRSNTNNDFNFGYRYQHPYRSFQGHQFSVDWNRKIGMNSYVVQTSETNIQDYRFFVRHKKLNFLPALIFKQQKLSKLHIGGRYNRFWFSLRANQLEENPNYFQTLSGIYRKNFRWLLQGEQNPAADQQQYRLTLSGNFHASHYFSAGTENYYRNGYREVTSYFSLNGQLKGTAYYQHIRHNSEAWDWSGGVSRLIKHGYFAADLSLTNWRLEKKGRASLNVVQYLPGDVLWNSRLQCGYLLLNNCIRTEINQQLNLPVGESCGITFLWNCSSGSRFQAETIGSGFSAIYPWPFYVQIVQNRALHPFGYRADYGAVFSLSGKQFLNCYGTISWAGNLFQFAEICVQQPDSNKISPGLLYQYLRPYEQRIEGFLEWRW